MQETGFMPHVSTDFLKRNQKHTFIAIFPFERLNLGMPFYTKYCVRKRFVHTYSLNHFNFVQFNCGSAQRKSRKKAHYSNNIGFHKSNPLHHAHLLCSKWHFCLLSVTPALFIALGCCVLGQILE